MRNFRVIDSHTGGEPTRTIVEGGPDLGSGPMDQRVRLMHSEFDHYRKSLVNEPRGSEVMVGAMLVPPLSPESHSGIIFFNNVGYLGMCGHGTIGVVESLRYLDRIHPGKHRFETCVGDVFATLHEDRTVTIENVVSYRAHSNVRLSIPNIGELAADIAYGGNWFCLVHCPEDEWLDKPVSELLAISQQILASCREQYPEVDHVELFAKPKNAKNSSRNFVLCPGGAYDRSPCGTGTSAKLACLAADGVLAEGETWYQESIIGSVFEGRFQWADSDRTRIIPSITSRAHVNSDNQILIDQDDPFTWGF